jgi:tetratricopeptide (TPR) repeat protein
LSVADGARIIEAADVRRTIGRGLVSAMLLASGFTPCPMSAQEAQLEISPANRLYLQAVAEGDRASKLERRRKREPAIEAYQLAGQLAEASIAEAERTGVAQQNRPPEVYFLCATSYLHAGRLLSYEDGDSQRKDENLRKAVIYLDMVEKIEAERAQKVDGRLNPEIWRVRNAAGYASFLRGELAQARLHYGSVLELNPSYTPAEQAIAEINKLEQQQNELFTPQGRTLQKEKNRKVLREIVQTLRLVRDIVTLGR